MLACSCSGWQRVCIFSSVRSRSVVLISAMLGSKEMRIVPEISH